MASQRLSPVTAEILQAGWHCERRLPFSVVAERIGRGLLHFWNGWAQVLGSGIIFIFQCQWPPPGFISLKFTSLHRHGTISLLHN